VAKLQSKNNLVFLLGETLNQILKIREIIISDKPKKSIVECLVPNCKRTWRLSGGHQGFTFAAAQSHAYAHWRRYHAEQKHPKAMWKDSDGKEHESWSFCQICKTTSEKELKKRRVKS
jgi:hypothetical protein